MVLLSPVALLVVLTALLYVTPIQQWAARQVAAAASDATGLDISVEHVDLSFSLDLGIDGILVLQPSTPPDTIARRPAVEGTGVYLRVSVTLLLSKPHQSICSGSRVRVLPLSSMVSTR